MKPLSIKTRLLRAQTLAEAQEIFRDGKTLSKPKRFDGLGWEWTGPHPSTIRKWKRIIKEKFGI